MLIPHGASRSTGWVCRYMNTPERRGSSIHTQLNQRPGCGCGQRNSSFARAESVAGSTYPVLSSRTRTATPGALHPCQRQCWWLAAGQPGHRWLQYSTRLARECSFSSAAPRILPTEDEDISAAVASAFRSSGIDVHENFGDIASFEKTPGGVRMNYRKGDDGNSAEASLAVVAVGWQANTAELNLAATGAKIDERGFVLVDSYLRTTAPHIFAAGDVTGRLLLVPPAIQDGFVAATNAVRGSTMTLDNAVNPVGSFTDPEYAQVGLTEAQARAAHRYLDRENPVRRDHARSSTAARSASAN